ncbi:extracellular solute-binding protein [Paenibacillus woosongensis]|uniref:Extracellular solute-binding protein n=1 Tax=Paenibacillus woosongensis TaxID=307580 RepID=A0AA95I8M0_9BACL|nr:extracellular solute-binding protein [Paenibacillus woosongensis]WHX49444.1 extracellular solute-binding protein [Paenibacillus woosongensis]
MKRITKMMVSTLLVASLAVGLSACGNSSGTNSSSGTNNGTAPKAEKVTLSFWGISTAEPERSELEKIIKEWNDNNPDIQIEYSGTENNAYKTKIKTAIAAGEAPDIMYSWTGGFAQPFVEAGKILSLDEYLTDETKDQMLPGALDNITYDGKVYGITYGQMAGALYVNTELFDQYQVKIPTTFSELMTAVDTFNQNGVKPMITGMKDLWPGMWIYDMIALRESGSQLSLDALNGKASFTDPAFVNAADKIQQLVNAGAFGNGVLGMTQDEAEAEFNQGKVAMLFGGNWMASKMEADSSMVKGKIKAVRFPASEDGKGDPTEYVGGGSDAMLVSADTKYKEQAVKAATYLAKAQAEQGYLSGINLPTWKYDSLDQSQINPLAKEIMDNIITGAAGSVPVWDIYLNGADAKTHQDLVAEVFANQITPEQFGAQMQDKVNGN